MLKNANEIWHVHDVDNYAAAADYATFQAFKVRKGIVSDCRNY